MHWLRWKRPNCVNGHAKARSHFDWRYHKQLHGQLSLPPNSDLSPPMGKPLRLTLQSTQVKVDQCMHWPLSVVSLNQELKICAPGQYQI